MKAKSISENLEFHRGKTTKELLNLGLKYYLIIINELDDTYGGLILSLGPEEALEELFANQLFEPGNAKLWSKEKENGAKFRVFLKRFDISTIFIQEVDPSEKYNTFEI